MNLVFNALNSGLGNNGGSRTLLKTQETLESLGHECNILATIDKFTWFKHKKIISEIPENTDAIIATACTTVDSTHTFSVKKKAWYIRAHETWAMNEKNLIKKYKSGLHNICNSNALKYQLEQYGIKSDVIYQGIDFEKWYDAKLRANNKIKIGCLHTTQPRKRWVDFVELANILGFNDYEYVGIGSSKPKETFLTKFICNGSSDDLKDLYSSCHIWFAPTNNEGLHNVPMEAALCGCLIVCSDAPLNGMIKDYADNETAMIYNYGDIRQAAELIRNPNWSLIPKMQNNIKTNIGSRKQNVQKLITLLQSYTS